jgi:hypothetical protein
LIEVRVTLRRDLRHEWLLRRLGLALAARKAASPFLAGVFGLAGNASSQNGGDLNPITRASDGTSSPDVSTSLPTKGVFEMTRSRYALVFCSAAMLAGCGGGQPPALAAGGQGLATIPRASEWVKRYRFRTLDNPADPTYNSLTGINNAGVISGYYGTGTTGHPSKGYTLAPPYTRPSYTTENYPGSTQTKVMAIDNLGNTVGNFVDKQRRSWGFIEWNSVFARYKQQPLYGLNDAGNTIVSLPKGYYSYKVYTLNQATRKLTLIYKFPQYHDGFTYGTGLNDAGDAVGITSTQGGSFGWAIVGGELYGGWSCHGKFGDYSVSAAAINNNDEIVGLISERTSYDGVVLKNLLTKPTCETVDDPNGIGTTSINGVNDKGALVGTYVDSAGNTNGFLATPR